MYYFAVHFNIQEGWIVGIAVDPRFPGLIGEFF